MSRPLPSPSVLGPPARAHPRELRVLWSFFHSAGRMGRLDQSTGSPVHSCTRRYTQASSARAAGFFAAFTSRPMSSPQVSQWNTRDHRLSLGLEKLTAKRTSGSALFTGTRAMFTAAGFIEAGRTFPTRPVMRRGL